MSDLISRQAAINSLHMHLMYRMGTDSNKKRLDDWINSLPSAQETHDKCTETHACDLISRQAAIAEFSCCELTPDGGIDANYAIDFLEQLQSAQPDTEKICAKIKAEAIKRNVEYMKHGDRYMLGFVDGMRLARRIVDGTIDDPVYFTLSGE